MEPQKVSGGAVWHQTEYHESDFVLIKADEGPCHIGHVLEINLPRRGRAHDKTKVRVHLLGRIDKLGNRPATTLKDEVRGPG